MTHALRMEFGDDNYIFLDDETNAEIEAFKNVLDLPTNTVAIRINKIDLEYFTEGE